MTVDFLSREELLDRMPQAHTRLPALVELHEADYALTRFVRANCLVTDNEPTPLVIKGGFAVRHIYGGLRFSKDADVVVRAPDLKIEGVEPDMLKIPAGMEITQRTLSRYEKSWIVKIQYMRTDEKIGHLQCDLNTRVRALRLPPPRAEDFESFFFAPFKVWAASAEEIVAEKLAALLEEKTERIRDAFDLCTVLAVDPESWDASACKELLARLLRAKRLSYPSSLVNAVTEIAKLEHANAAWAAQVISVIPTRPKTLDDVVEELAGLLSDSDLA